jgi:hypothetical protein
LILISTPELLNVHFEHSLYPHGQYVMPRTCTPAGSYAAPKVRTHFVFPQSHRKFSIAPVLTYKPQRSLVARVSCDTNKFHNSKIASCSVFCSLLWPGELKEDL